MMPHWSVLLELYSLVILLILFLRCYRYGRELTKKANLEQFSRCLLLSMAFILLNLLCMGTLARTDIIPVPINLVLNSAYFLLAIHLCTAYAQILFRDMLQHVYQEKCKRRARIGLTAITALGDGCVVLNLFTGILFYIDAAGNYRRGPLNRIQFLWLLAEIGMLAMCYYRNRASISPQSVSVMRNAPAIAAILSVVQIFFPDLLLNGTTCALISLIMFFSYCSHSQTQDGLTGLGNRMVFLDELSGYLGQPLQIVQVSLLNLADLNVAYGHATGDNLLYEMGAFLRKTGVQVFRTGSTTFTLMVPFTREEKADALLDTVQIRMRQDWQFGAVSFRIAFAMAEARYPRVPDSISQVVEELEYTMLQARKKQKLVRFDETLRRELNQRDRLLEWMRLCIGENKFRVVYQPIYCCRQGLFCAALTALVRRERDWFVFLMPAAITSCCWTYTQAYSHAMGWFVAFVLVRALLRHPQSRFLWALAALAACSLSRGFLAWHGLVAFAGWTFPLSDYAFRCWDSLNSTLSLGLAAAQCVWLWQTGPCPSGAAGRALGDPGRCPRISMVFWDRPRGVVHECSRNCTNFICIREI